MPRKSIKTIKKVKVEEPQVEEEVLASEPVIQEMPQARQVEVLPSGVIRKSIVDINGKKYTKFWRIDGTSDIELLSG